MSKPYIVCYMMASLDGRIDCAMTGQLKGVEDYYKVLKELDLKTTVSGRVTAELEMALPGKFEEEHPEAYGKEGFSLKTKAEGYEAVLDSKGTLLWPEETSSEKPHLILTSESVSKGYLEYLDGQNISWIACGKEHVDLKRASEILAEEFGVERMGLVGGPVMNTAFLNAGLVEEVDVLIGAGIDGREEMESLFEGRKESKPLPLKLQDVKRFDSDAVLLRYTI